MKRARFRFAAIVDQAAYTGGNLLLQVAVAATTTAAGFGRFAVVYSIEVLAEGAARSLLGELVLAEGALGDVQGRSSVARSLRRRSASLSLVGGVVVGFAGLVILGSLGWVMGIAATAAIRADWNRHLLLGHRRAAAAAVCSAAWSALVAIPAVYVVVSGGTAGPVIVAWCVGAIVAAVLGRLLVVNGDLHDEGALATRPLARRSRLFVFDYASRIAVGQIAVLVVGALAGYEAAGSYRAVVVLFGPVAVLTMAVRSIVLAEAENGSVSRSSEVIVAGVIPIGAAIVLTALVIAASSHLETALGPSFGVGGVVLLIYGFGRIALAATAGPAARLRLEERDAEAVWLRIAAGAALILAIAIAAAASGGADLRLQRIAAADALVNVVAFLGWRAMARSAAYERSPA